MADPAPPSSPLRRHLPVLLILAAWLAVNFLSLTRYPCAWGDEISYADPAVNWVLHGKWMSTTWYGQRIDEFFAGNVPLYMGIMIPWLKIFGVSMAAIRSLNLALMVIVVVVLYNLVLTLAQASRRARAAGIFLTILLLFGYSLIFIYRGGRPDVLCMALMAVPALAVAAKWRYRLAAVFIFSFLFPWAGLQLLPMLVVVTLFLLAIDWRQYLPVFILAGIGSTLGLLCVLEFYHLNGVLPAFFRSIAPHVRNPGAAYRPKTPKDFSFMVLLLGAIFAAVGGWHRGGLRLRSPLALGLLLSIAIGAALMLTGVFPTYYGWMTYVPLSVGCVLEWANGTLGHFSERVLLCAFVGAIVAGIAFHACSAWYNWPYRDPAIPDRVVSRNVHPGDIPYGDACIYYALLNHGFTPYVDFYDQVMTQEEKDRTTVLLVNPALYQDAVSRIGGSWKQVDSFIPPKRGFLGTHWNMGFLSEFDYTLLVYRRSR